ncbi:glycerol-3-phosphate dehydrogenase/oxidase [Paenibacillus albicereus]|uniref:Glycerol-3-phosphate dehydrogenase n=1 Tax=Paenibacillus albicereus TaxID=2726185 RepID=A0A6H2GUH5_9BACL|nr:FAD-dependent oxidoreductase [Paenibacillus albicereus]QJC51042.1 glycerol-3-phosphate dehydrogenase/oxidase [Paenibacillus albicereus]
MRAANGPPPARGAAGGGPGTAGAGERAADRAGERAADRAGGRAGEEPPAFSALERESLLSRLQGETWDVLVIGGGITGAGIALDAASRGLKTALVEMQDFAAGTSSRSTKLVHGGLRYLKQLEVRMVAEVGRERAIVYENGPHVTVPERMLLPIYRGGTFGRWSTSLGLALYDRLAGVKLRERRRMLGADQTAELEPLLKRDGLLGGGSYVEYRTDDSRLTIEVAKKAAELGACAVNYVKAEGLLYDSGAHPAGGASAAEDGRRRLCGIRAVDRIGGSEFELRARVIVNAAGPWVDGIRELDGSRQGKTLRLTKGVHLVFDGARFPLRQAVYFDTPDGRMMFAIPRDGKTYVGTTDTDYDGDPAHPRMSEEDRRYIVDAAAAMFPKLRLTADDVESSWAGLRPLIFEEGKDPSEISRRDEIFRSDSGLLTIAGGKLTGYRKMAETVTDLVVRELERAGHGPFGRCRTRTLPVSGGDVGGSAGLPAAVAAAAARGSALGLPEEDARRIAERYGSNAAAVLEQLPDEASARSAGLPRALMAELRYAMRSEMAARPADFLVRRTGLALFDREAAVRWREPALRLMARELGWTDGQLRSGAEELDRELANAVQPQA